MRKCLSVHVQRLSTSGHSIAHRPLSDLEADSNLYAKLTWVIATWDVALREPPAGHVHPTVGSKHKGQQAGQHRGIVVITHLSASDVRIEMCIANLGEDIHVAAHTGSSAGLDNTGTIPNDWCGRH